MAEGVDAEWSKISYPLKDLMKNFALPLLVMVDEGYMLNESESLASGQLITIQSQEDITHLKGSDADGKAISIPTKCPFKVKLVAQHEGTRYRGIRELSAAATRPKYVEVVSKGRRDLGLVKIGDKLKILLSERGPDGPSYLHFRNQRGKHLRLPVDFGGEFCACAEDSKEHLLQDLTVKELPLFIKFVDNSKKISVGESIGVIELKECVTETLVFASTKFNGKVFATAFPITFDIKVRPMANARRNHEQPMDPRSEIIDLDSFRDFMSKEQVVNENGYVCFAPYDMVKRNENLSLTEDPTKICELDTKENRPKWSEVENDYEVAIQRHDPKRKSTGFLSKVKFKLRGGSKQENREPKSGRPEIVIVRETGASSDGGDSGIYEEIPGDTYVSMDVIDGVRRALGTSATKTSTLRKRSLTRVQSSAAPPPLPQNHPLERRHTLTARLRGSKDKSTAMKFEKSDAKQEKEHFRMFYESMKKSQLELLRSDVDGVGDVLRALKLGKYVRNFEESQIDGKLLIDLDEAVFKDMGLTSFESRKLRKYVFGWRPDNDTGTAKSTGKDDKNPEARKWTEIEVEEHLAGLGLQDFAGFCKENQVNGDLLWDLVVDDEMISELLKGKDRRLNVVKLKNYVIEGWRPKVNTKKAKTASNGTAKIGLSGGKPRKGRTSEPGTDLKNTNYMSLKFEKSAKPSSSSAYQVPATRKTAEKSNAPSSFVPSKSQAINRSVTSNSSAPLKGQSSRRSSTPNSSASSCIESPRDVSSGNKEPRNRLQAKVTYPKNSPYRKSEAMKGKGQNSADKTNKSKEIQEKSITESKSKTGVEKNAKSTVVNQREGGAKVAGKTLFQGGAGNSPKNSSQPTSSVEKRSQNEQVANASKVESNFRQKETSKPKSRLSWFGKGAKATETDKGGLVAKQANKKDTGKQGEKEVARTQNAKKTKKAQTSTDRENTGNDVTKTRPNQDTVAKKSALGQDRRVQSPMVTNLKKQYETKEGPSFVQSQPLLRSGKRAALKRKESNGSKNSEKETSKPSTSVAQLRKQFDGK